MRRFRPYLDPIFPRTCSLCSCTIIEAERESVCEDCENQIIPTESSCYRCSAPIVRRESDNFDFPIVAKCQYCEKRKWAFDRAFCFTAYSGLAKTASRKLKSKKHEPLAIYCGNLLGKWLLSHTSFDRKAYDFVIPISQHWIVRIKDRYNQAEVLARQVAKHLQLRYRPHWLFRTRWTSKQGTKLFADRLNNVVDSFDCKAASHLQGKRLLLVDDVMTSGATLHDAAKALLKKGAIHADVATFARGAGSSVNKPKTRTENVRSHSH